MAKQHLSVLHIPFAKPIQQRAVGNLYRLPDISNSPFCEGVPIPLR